MYSKSAALNVLLLLSLSACAADKFDSAQLGQTLPAPDAPGASVIVQKEYRIGALDKITINVFQMKDLSLEKIQVDASGQLLLPLIGSMQAQGKSASELSKDIAAKLSECCLQNPQVIVQVDEAVSQQITVTGAVMESNVYNLRGRTTLVQAISMAKGPDRQVANLKRVAVYRFANGQRMGALFDVEAIRAGRSPDPEIFGGDTIIVDSSNSRAAWRDIVSSVPFLGVFAAF
jgi:polysaccharide biosynthesis/export protein